MSHTHSRELSYNICLNTQNKYWWFHTQDPHLNMPPRNAVAMNHTIHKVLDWAAVIIMISILNLLSICFGDPTMIVSMGSWSGGDCRYIEQDESWYRKVEDRVGNRVGNGVKIKSMTNQSD